MSNDKTITPPEEVKKPRSNDAPVDKEHGEGNNGLNLVDLSDAHTGKGPQKASDSVLTAAGRDAIREGTLSKEALDQIVSRARETHSDSLVVMKDGKLVAQWYSNNEQKVMLTHSMTKSVTNLAVGQLVGEGKLSLDQKVGDFFPEWKTGDKKDVTVRELMNHTSGMPFHAKEPTLHAALDANLLTKPGTNFEYSTAAVDVLAGIVEKVSGKPMDKYAADNILKPLGITNYKWEEDAEGHAEGGTGLWANATDLAKIGQMMLNGGRWEGKQIVSSDWIAQSTKPSQNLNKECGLLWWLEDPRFNADQSGHSTYVGAEGFSAHGAFGQYLVISPKEHLVAVRQIDKANYKSDDDFFTDFSPLARKLVPDKAAPILQIHY